MPGLRLSRSAVIVVLNARRAAGGGVLHAATKFQSAGPRVPADGGARAVLEMAGDVTVEPAVRALVGKADTAGLGSASGLAVPDGDVGQIG